MKIQNKLIQALVTILIGALLIIWKTGVVSIAITALGVYFVVMGILDLVHKKEQTPAIIKIAIGAVAILLAWLITQVAVIILGVVIAFNGVMQILAIVNSDVKYVKLVDRIMVWAGPVLSVIAGLFIIFGNGLDWAFIVFGVLVIIEGVVSLIEALK